jgi:hypothetical protein
MASIVAIVISAGAVGIDQAVGGESDRAVSTAQEHRAARAALNVVDRSRLVDIEHDAEGLAAWKVRVLKPGHHLDGFSARPVKDRHIAIYLDRDYQWLHARVERFGPEA